MATSYGALCSDFYVNQKLALKMDLPKARETVLDLFDRIRKELPAMDQFRRYEGELALESAHEDSRYDWVALRRTSIRSGSVNPDSLAEAYKLHRLILDIAPYFLSISPLDVDFIELVFGFDFEAERNRNAVVFDALMADSQFSSLVDQEREVIIDTQPFIGFALDEACELQAYMEVKPRTQVSEIASERYEREPISVYLTVRKYSALKSLEDLVECFGELSAHAERLADERVIPHLVMPIRESNLSGPH